MSKRPAHPLLLLAGAMIGTALLVFGCAEPGADVAGSALSLAPDPALVSRAAAPPVPACPFRDVVVIDDARTCISIRHDTAPRGLWAGIKVVDDIVTDQGRLKGS